MYMTHIGHYETVTDGQT